MHENIDVNLKAQKRVDKRNHEDINLLEGDEDDLRVEDRFMGRVSDSDEEDDIDMELRKNKIGRLSTSPKKAMTGVSSKKLTK